MNQDKHHTYVSNSSELQAAKNRQVLVGKKFGKRLVGRKDYSKFKGSGEGISLPNTFSAPTIKPANLKKREYIQSVIEGAKATVKTI